MQPPWTEQYSGLDCREVWYDHGGMAISRNGKAFLHGWRWYKFPRKSLEKENLFSRHSDISNQSPAYYHLLIHKFLLIKYITSSLPRSRSLKSLPSSLLLLSAPSRLLATNHQNIISHHHIPLHQPPSFSRLTAVATRTRTAAHQVNLVDPPALVLLVHLSTAMASLSAATTMMVLKTASPASLAPLPSSTNRMASHAMVELRCLSKTSYSPWIWMLVRVEKVMGGWGILGLIRG